MNTKRDPREIAETILHRSICSVRVGACIEKNGRIVSWGWNGVSSGFGLHAEAHAISRANRDRLNGATIFVASERLRNGKVVFSKPCDECQALLDKWGVLAHYRNGEGKWV